MSIIKNETRVNFNVDMKLKKMFMLECVKVDASLSSVLRGLVDYVVEYPEILRKIDFEQYKGI